MGFTTEIFLFAFLPASILGYYFLGLFRTRSPKIRILFLFVLSLIFYLWSDPYYFGFTLILVLVNVVAWRLFGLRNTDRFILSLVILDVIVLTFFKLWERNLIPWFENSSIPEAFLGRMPLGISFIVFSLLAYLLDVKKKRIPADHSLSDAFLSQVFFAKIISGPITRFQQFISSGQDENSLDDLAAGIRRFIIGFIKKVLIADTVAIVANQVFELDPSVRSMAHAWVGLFAYTLQIFYDFSGYTDMALGLGRIFGFQLPENFDYPYIAKSIQDFWRRWHITLSNWFRDYVFFPLERTSRKYSFWPRFINVWIVFFLTGIWHGFTWNFVIWGMIHGVAISLENGVYGKRLSGSSGFFQVFYTLVIVMAGWVFFRTETVGDALGYFQSLFKFSIPSSTLPVSQFSPVETYTWIIIAVGIVFSTPLLNYFAKKYINQFSGEEARPGLLALSMDLGLLLLFVLAIMVNMGQSYTSFLYGRF